MKGKTDTLDLSNLPDDAKREIMEFYQYITRKYVEFKDKDKKASKKADILKTLLPKPVKKFVPLKRNELYEK